MNGPIRRVSVFVALIFASLVLNISYASVFRAETLNADSRNRRVQDADFSQDRGVIFVGDLPVAKNEPSKGRFSYQRVYPSGSEYAHLTGYYSYIYGRAELEKTYNADLSGTSNKQVFNRFLDMISGRSPVGASLQTTIDSKAQQAARKALGQRKGAVIALDYSSGAVLAMVSSPSYDPNLLATLDLATSKKNWKTLSKDPNNPIKNRATSEIYPPGSTFKLIVASAAIKAGYSPESIIDSPDSLPLPQSKNSITNSSDCGGTKTTLENALRVSCNTAFSNLGMKLGADKIREEAKAFGFNAETKLDLPSVKSKFPEKLDKAQLAMSSIGQFDVAASPLQMALVVAAIANNGVMMEPYLVSEIRSQDLKILSSHTSSEMNKPLSAEQAKKMKQMMLKVVEKGTGTRANVPGMIIGGKTGTAQHGDKKKPYSWFVGYADNPKVALAVFVEEPNSDDQIAEGGRLAAPIAKEVFKALK